jgi:Flp pilus assembly protein TadG
VTAIGSGERGSTTLWVLALSLLLLMVGGISLDLWRALADHRQLVGVADAAAVAAASGVDVDHFRETGEVRLSDDRATRLAHRLIAAQCSSGGSCRAVEDVSVVVSGVSVAVELRRGFDLTLLGLAVPEGLLAERLEVVARAHADASFRP